MKKFKPNIKENILELLSNETIKNEIQKYNLNAEIVKNAIDYLDDFFSKIKLDDIIKAENLLDYIPKTYKSFEQYEAELLGKTYKSKKKTKPDEAFQIHKISDLVHCEISNLHNFDINLGADSKTKLKYEHPFIIDICLMFIRQILDTLFILKLQNANISTYKKINLKAFNSTLDKLFYEYAPLFFTFYQSNITKEYYVERKKLDKTYKTEQKKLDELYKNKDEFIKQFKQKLKNSDFYFEFLFFLNKFSTKAVKEYNEITNPDDITISPKQLLEIYLNTEINDTEFDIFVKKMDYIIILLQELKADCLTDFKHNQRKKFERFNELIGKDRKVRLGIKNEINKDEFFNSIKESYKDFLENLTENS